MSEAANLFGLDVPFFLGERRLALPGDLRILRRVALVTLLLGACRGGKATIQQLHVLNWAVRSKESRKTFLGFLRGEVRPDEAVVRYDPSLSRAVDYARHEHLITDAPEQAEMMPSQSPLSYRIALASAGRELAAWIAEEDLLVDERIYLEEIGKLAQSRIAGLFDGRQL